jgi:hypothetical protein
VSTRLMTAIAISAVAMLSLVPAAAQAAQFEGTVVSKNKSARTFSIKQDEGGGTFTIKVNKATKYQRIAGFGAIKPGLKNIEVVAKKNRKGRWIATKVEVSGKSGGGNAGGGGSDDGPNHT